MTMYMAKGPQAPHPQVRPQPSEVACSPAQAPSAELSSKGSCPAPRWASDRLPVQCSQLPTSQRLPEGQLSHRSAIWTAF